MTRIVAVLAVAFAFAASASAHTVKADPLTCAWAPGHKLIGCLRYYGHYWLSNNFCNVGMWGPRTKWVWAEEGTLGAPDAYAGALGGGAWRIGDYGSGAPTGWIEPVGDGTAEILDAHRRLLAFAHGPDPQVAGLLLVHWGSECFP